MLKMPPKTFNCLSGILVCVNTAPFSALDFFITSPYNCDDDVLAEPTKFDHTKMNTLNVNCRNAKEMLRDAIEDLKSKGHL